LRLAGVSPPRARRALPWLIPERNYMGPLIVTAFAYLALAIYDEYTLEVWEIIPKQARVLSTTCLVFTGCLACIFPFIRKVDDLFNISTELVIVTALLLILSSKITMRFFVVVIRWVVGNLNFIVTALIFGIR
ncbi:unnamed protein product, partial [Hapterophycus canaliculatus]